MRIRTPFIRKSANDWSRQTGPNGGTFWRNIRTGENKYQQENPGGSASSSQPDAGGQQQAAPQADKTQGYVDQLKQKFGDQAAAKVDAMRAKLAAEPGNEAKVAALDKVKAGLSPAKAEAKPDATPQADDPAAKTHHELTQAAESGSIDDVRRVLDNLAKQPGSVISDVGQKLGYSPRGKSDMLRRIKEHAEGIAVSKTRTGLIPTPFGKTLRHVSKNTQWAESKHPRADDGKFGEGHGSAKPAKADAKSSGDKPKRSPPGSQLPEPQKAKLREYGMTGTFPPADVPISEIKFADLSKGADDLKYTALMSWNQKTGSGRISRQYRYTEAFHNRNAEEKFSRVMEIEPTLPAAKTKLAESMASGDQRKKEGAAIASIIMETGLRPTDSDESVEHGHYGVGSILAKHVKIDGNTAYLDFIGKEGVRNKATISDPDNVKYLKAAIAGKSEDVPVFAGATSQDALEQLKAATGKKDAKLKDLRTIRATQEARKVVGEFKGPPPPLSGDAKKDGKAIAKGIIEMSGKVAVILNNTPTMARDNYIHPEVFRSWQKTLTSEKTTPTKTMSKVIWSPLRTKSKTPNCEPRGKLLSANSPRKDLGSDFDESKHPRDAGKFASAPGVSADAKPSLPAKVLNAAKEKVQSSYAKSLRSQAIPTPFAK